MNLFQFDSRIEYFFNMSSRIEPSFLHDSINGTFVLFDSENWPFFYVKKYNSNHWTFFMTQRIEPSFQQVTQRIETFLNQRIELFFQKKKYDSKNWTFFQHDSKNWIWLKGLNLFFFVPVWPKDFFLIFFKYVSKDWTI